MYLISCLIRFPRAGPERVGQYCLGYINLKLKHKSGSRPTLQVYE